MHFKVEDAMLDEVSLWIHGKKKRGLRERVLKCAVSDDALFTLAADTNIEREAMARQCIERLSAAAKKEHEGSGRKPKTKACFIALFESGGYVTAALHRKYGFKHDALHNAKTLGRNILEEAL
jgi:hypothetical protein